MSLVERIGQAARQERERAAAAEAPVLAEGLRRLLGPVGGEVEVTTAGGRAVASAGDWRLVLWNSGTPEEPQFGGVALWWECPGCGAGVRGRGVDSLAGLDEELSLFPHAYHRMCSGGAAEAGDIDRDVEELLEYEVEPERGPSATNLIVHEIVVRVEELVETYGQLVVCNSNDGRRLEKQVLARLERGRTFRDAFDQPWRDLVRRRLGREVPVLFEFRCERREVPMQLYRRLGRLLELLGLRWGVEPMLDWCRAASPPVRPDDRDVVDYSQMPRVALRCQR